MSKLREAADKVKSSIKNKIGNVKESGKLTQKSKENTKSKRKTVEMIAATINSKAYEKAEKFKESINTKINTKIGNVETINTIVENRIAILKTFYEQLCKLLDSRAPTLAELDTNTPQKTTGYVTDMELKFTNQLGKILTQARTNSKIRTSKSLTKWMNASSRLDFTAHDTEPYYYFDAECKTIGQIWTEDVWGVNPFQYNQTDFTTAVFYNAFFGKDVITDITKYMDSITKKPFKQKAQKDETFTQLLNDTKKRYLDWCEKSCKEAYNKTKEIYEKMPKPKAVPKVKK